MATKQWVGAKLYYGASLALAGSAGAAWMFLKLRRAAITRLALFPRIVGQRTPQDLEMDFEEVWFPSRDGLQLHGWYIPAVADNHFYKDITIIMGHGHSGNKEPDLEYTRFFRQAGYNVFMFDFRRHGRSEGPLGSSMGHWERLDVHGAVDWLLGRGQERFAAFGISMGAAIMILAAAENPYIRAVIADSPYAHLHRSIAAEVNNGFNGYRLPMWAARPVGHYGWRMLAKHQRFPHRGTNPADQVAKIAPRPLFLIHGDHDRITRVENAHILYKIAQEPKELWIQPGVPHAGGYIVYGSEYEQRVLDFLDRVAWQEPVQLSAPSHTLEGFKTGG